MTFLLKPTEKIDVKKKTLFFKGLNKKTKT